MTDSKRAIKLLRYLRCFGALAWIIATLVMIFGVSATTAITQVCPNEAFRVRNSADLPDCRVYEQVSPVNKGGFAAYPPQSMPVRVSSSGEALAYLNFSAFPGAVGNTALYSAHVSTRTLSGWQTAEWTPKVPKAEVLRAYKVNYDFSDDLSQAILQIPVVPLVSGATPYASNLYLRRADGTYSLINSTPPARSIEELCGPTLLALCWQFFDISTFAGASTDFSHVIFESSAQLTPEAPITGVQSLYESSGGHVRLVGVLPDGNAAASSTVGAGSSVLYTTLAMEADRSVERAVSQDGSHVIFSAPSDGEEPNSNQNGMTEVYVRIDGSETIEISAPASGATPAVSNAEPATFQTASIDGSRVFFTSSAELTTQSNTGEANNSEDLYEYNLETKQLTDLTVDTNPEDASTGAMVRGVIDSSNDGSYVYFVADGQLIEGKGVDGQPNLYMVHNNGIPVFIATLNNGNCNFSANESGDSCTWSPFPLTREAYVTPDGKHMAFMSTQSLPTINFPNGYNNIDQESGKADSEVYEYTAPTRPGGTGQLACASCDPTGAQPVGNALIGGISPSGGIGLNGTSTPFYRVRALTDDGRRLYYTAPVSVGTLPGSVYEYEQSGSGSCSNPGGCHSLISTSNTAAADYFLGASADGNDVFFSTSNQLVSTDRDNLSDVYDARIGGGIAQPPIELQCETQCVKPSPIQTDTALSTGTVGKTENLPPRTSPTAPRCKAGFKLSHKRCVRAKRKQPHRYSKQAHTRATRSHRRMR